MRLSPKAAPVTVCAAAVPPNPRMTSLATDSTMLRNTKNITVNATATTNVWKADFLFIFRFSNNQFSRARCHSETSIRAMTTPTIISLKVSSVKRDLDMGSGI